MTYPAPPRHPARVMPYCELLDGLIGAKTDGLVSEKCDGDHSLFCYTQRATYERAWTPIVEIARGLILDRRRETVVATPFPKFFNLGERGNQVVPNTAFDTLEKLDGSLIIIWHDGEMWRCCTKGSFNSNQAHAAIAWLDEYTVLAELRRGATYLAEWIAPDNRIVVRYDQPELVLLSMYEEDGSEPVYPLLQETADRLGWQLAQRHHFGSIADLVARAATLPATREGFVLRFWDGLRLKIKGDEYRRIHALISRCTPLAMWEAMEAGDNLDLIRQQLPEEFWADFDQIVSLLGAQVQNIINLVGAAAIDVAAWSDKEVGLQMNSGGWNEPVRSFIFPYRKTDGNLLSGKTRHALFRAIRPTGNVLDGYTPSYAMNRMIEEDL